MSQTLLKLLVGGGAMAGIAAATKPSKESFTKYFRAELQDQLTENNYLPIFVNKLIARGVKASARTQFKNYGVCRVAIVELPSDDEELYFLGAFGNWFEIPSLEIVDELGLSSNDE